MLPPARETADRGLMRSRIIAFIPITLALLGVGAILFGGISARDPATAVSALEEIDPIQTGSIAPERDHRRDIEMLDR
jgi:hypothetical protein